MFYFLVIFSGRLNLATSFEDFNVTLLLRNLFVSNDIYRRTVGEQVEYNFIL